MTTPANNTFTPTMTPFTISTPFKKSLLKELLKAKTRKAELVDELFVDYFKLIPNLMSGILCSIWFKFSDTSHTLHEWQTTILFLIYKKGGNTLSASYRTIDLLSHIRKIIDAAIALEVHRQYRFHDPALGFRPGTGTDTATVRHVKT